MNGESYIETFNPQTKQQATRRERFLRAQLANKTRGAVRGRNEIKKEVNYRTHQNSMPEVKRE